MKHAVNLIVSSELLSATRSACFWYWLYQTRDTVWLVIFVRDLFLRFSRAKSHSRKLKPQNFSVHMQSEQTAFQSRPTYTAGNRSVSASVPLMAIAEAIQKIEMLAM